jgi:hypothetical protein
VLSMFLGQYQSEKLYLSDIGKTKLYSETLYKFFVDVVNGYRIFVKSVNCKLLRLGYFQLLRSGYFQFIHYLTNVKEISR